MRRKKYYTPKSNHFKKQSIKGGFSDNVRLNTNEENDNFPEILSLTSSDSSKLMKL